MIRRLAVHHEKILLALAAAALTASSTWWWRQQGGINLLRSRPEARRLTGAAFEPSNLPRPATLAAAWSPASAQSHGQGWRYELFTPPVIYYNRLARSFTVTPPLDRAGAGLSGGLELLAVRPEQFRLQLMGYFGEPDDYLAAFTSPLRPETLLARTGRRFEHLGLTLKSFTVKKVLVEHHDDRPVYEVAALAVVTDEQTGAEVLLDSRVRKFTDVPLAVFRTVTTGRPREMREGDTFTDDNSTYRVERIQLDPPEVVISRTAPGLPQPEISVLHPRAGLAGGRTGRTPKAGPFSPSSAPALATAGK